MAGVIGILGEWEYWQYEEDVYRVAQNNRGYMLPEGVPANARWECSIRHFEIWIRPKIAP